jgi:hypothetical protein
MRDTTAIPPGLGAARRGRRTTSVDGKLAREMGGEAVLQARPRSPSLERRFFSHIDDDERIRAAHLWHARGVWSVPSIRSDRATGSGSAFSSGLEWKANTQRLSFCSFSSPYSHTPAAFYSNTWIWMRLFARSDLYSNLIWLIRYDFPFLELMAISAAGGYRARAMPFIADQAMLMNRSCSHFGPEGFAGCSWSRWAAIAF